MKNKPSQGAVSSTKMSSGIFSQTSLGFNHQSKAARFRVTKDVVNPYHNNQQS